MYDLIGDIHGHADELEQLLEILGYRRIGRNYSHPNRQVIFVGDYIDRGPKIRQTLEIVRGMVDAGCALAVLGNHEINALAFHTESPDQLGNYLRPHTTKHVRQHQQTLDQVPSIELAEYMEWFRTMPLWLDLSELRVVHACWHPAAISAIEQALIKHNGITTPFLKEAFDHESELFRAVEVALKGPEALLPTGISYTDKDGNERDMMRTRWFITAENQTYRTYAIRSEEIASDDALSPQVVANACPYPVDAKPVFIGHYWMRPDPPSLLAPNVACLDYSVAKGGFLTAYRWDGESRLDDRKFVTVNAR